MPGCNLTVKVNGSVLGVANTTKHSHVTFDPFTNGGLLRINGSALDIKAQIRRDERDVEPRRRSDIYTGRLK